MQSLGLSNQAQPLYRPALAKPPAVAILPQFSGEKQTKTSPAEAKLSLWQHFMQWVKDWLRWLGNFFSAKPVSPFKQAVKLEAPKTEPISRVDPKLKADPYERNRVAYAIADEVFPKLVRLYQEKPHEDRGNLRLSWENLAQEVLNQSVQKHLHTQGAVWLSFLTGGGIGLGEYGPPDLSDGPQAIRSNLGDICINHPSTYVYDLSQEKDRQAVYSTLVHEIRHLVKAYAMDQCRNDPKEEPVANDPLKADYNRYLIGGGSDTLCNMGTSVIHFLKEQNSNLPPLDTERNLLKEKRQENFQRYWPDFYRLWERADYPMLSQMPAYKEKFTEILRQGDPKVLKHYLDRELLEELESYMTAMKRAPGLSTNQIQPSDFQQIGRALLLRDLLRYYYEVRQIPKDQQHPFAEIKPLQLIA
jgi:hypothetical protein